MHQNPIKQPQLKNLSLPSCFTFNFNKSARPWVRNGVDITDYFNFGLNEHTYKLYACKVRQSVANWDQRIEKDEEIQKAFVIEKKATVMQDNLPLELGGLSNLAYPETITTKNQVINTRHPMIFLQIQQQFLYDFEKTLIVYNNGMNYLKQQPFDMIKSIQSRLHYQTIEGEESQYNQLLRKIIESDKKVSTEIYSEIAQISVFDPNKFKPKAVESQKRRTSKESKERKSYRHHRHSSRSRHKRHKRRHSRTPEYKHKSRHRHKNRRHRSKKRSKHRKDSIKKSESQDGKKNKSEKVDKSKSGERNESKEVHRKDKRSERRRDSKEVRKKERRRSRSHDSKKERRKERRRSRRDGKKRDKSQRHEKDRKHKKRKKRDSDRKKSKEHQKEDNSQHKLRSRRGEHTMVIKKKDGTEIQLVSHKRRDSSWIHKRDSRRQPSKQDYDGS